MACEARTYADGSWFCQKCEIGGDKDEPIEDYCKLTRLNGSTATTGEAVEDDGFITVVPDLRSGHGAAHRHPADR